MNSLLSVIFVSLYASALFASGGEHHGAVHIPWGLVIPQALNFTIAVGVLVYFVRNPIKNYFKLRNEDFLTRLSEASVAREKAEAKNAEWKKRMAKLESTSDSSLSKAKEEAAEMNKKMMVEAKSLSERLIAEAEKTGEYELERVKNQLKEELLAQSMVMAENDLKEGIKSPEQDRLQNEFVNKMQAVL